MATVLKTVVLKGTVGSNPTLTATSLQYLLKMVLYYCTTK